MRNDDSYRNDLISVAGHINEIFTGGHEQQIIDEGPVTSEDFKKPSAVFSSTTAAIDGSNAMVFESGTFSIAAIRAVSVAFRAEARVFTKTTPVRLPKISNAGVTDEYRSLYMECFGEEPESPVDDEPSRAASVFRDTLEYWTAKKTIEFLDEGDCLMLDGNLRTSHASHNPVLSGITRDCGNRGIYLVSVSKRNSLTFGGYPLDIAIDNIAEEFGIKAPWYIRIPDHLPDQKRHEQWHMGKAYLIKLHQASNVILKAEMPKYADDSYADAAISACTAYSDDGRIPGYPYPLMEAHRECCITKETVDIIRQDLTGEINRKGIGQRECHKIFGDLHDEFARY